MQIIPLAKKQVADSSTPYNKDNPFGATILERRILTTAGSHKNTQHIALSIAGSGFAYQPGDSIGVYPQNDPEDVALALEALRCTGKEIVVHPKTQESLLLYDALLKHFSLTHVSRGFLALLQSSATGSQKDHLSHLLSSEGTEDFKVYLEGRDVIEALQDFSSARPPLLEFIKELRRLLPRLYSIATSPLLYPNQVHFTIGVSQSMIRGRLRKGVASHYLCSRASLGEPVVATFLAHSAFRLPVDDAADIIMIGPGTGIAPFRGFMQERVAKKAKGRNWLFFGEQQKAYDYLYGEEWEAYHQSGALTHLSLAFSRDQLHKVYVQDRMKESAHELWEWISNGAYIYVCGDKDHMAKDVDVMLHQIAQKSGHLSETDAHEFFKQLKKAKRYQRDVY